MPIVPSPPVTRIVSLVIENYLLCIPSGCSKQSDSIRILKEIVILKTSSDDMRRPI
jgi:hypothetical protein